MLTEVKAYSSWESVSELLLSDTGRAETDLVQIREINGLDPVKAAVGTAALAVDGVSYTGSNVPSRNIVLTIGLNPDWATWTFESLRRLLYSYFMPKQSTRLVFYSDDMDPVQIDGIVESFEVNPFSADPEIQVSIICPDPYFISLTPIIVTGSAIREGGTTTPVVYAGSIETGFYVKVFYTSGASPTEVEVQVGDSALSHFRVDDPTISSVSYFEMNSVLMQKYVQNVDMDTGVVTNLLPNVEDGSIWPTLKYGMNDFSIITDQGVQDWELSYYARFGGL